MDPGWLAPLALAMGMGLLVGLQREWSHEEVAGIRTFALITLLGCTAVLVGEAGGFPWIFPTGLGALALLVVMAGVTRARAGPVDPGLTTEVAILVMYLVGGMVGAGFRVQAVVLGAVVAVLLQAKNPLHGLVRSLGSGDIRAIYQFVLVALVILPILPDRGFGPFGVLNPFRIWLMVVLIVGISIVSYVAFRLLGRKGGTLAAGVLGGMISSTATTVSYARQARDHPGIVPSAGVVVVLASVVMFVRVLAEVALVAGEYLGDVVLPLSIVPAVLLLTALWPAGRGKGGEEGVMEDPDPPSELRTAILFGLLYSVVLVGIALARSHLGTGGLYAVAALSGLTDVDAITLSTAQLMRSGEITPDTGWRLILLGSLANLLFKGGVVMLLAPIGLAKRVGWSFGIALLAGGAIFVLLP
jgi:uncharacterized membrane protein (DUF4010 family)